MLLIDRVWRWVGSVGIFVSVSWFVCELAIFVEHFWLFWGVLEALPFCEVGNFESSGINFRFSYPVIVCDFLVCLSFYLRWVYSRCGVGLCYFW